MNLQDSFKFLSELTQNNSKEWMDDNRDWYQTCRLEWIAFVEEVLDGLKAVDLNLSDLKAKQTIFRLNRDIRFSNNKQPYKTNFGAAISEGGKKSGNPAYYVHFQPGAHFIGGGIYMPEAEALKKIRQEVDYNPEELMHVIKQPEFAEVYGEIKGEKLKTAPRGYAKDHPNIEFLRLKSFTVMRDVSDSRAKSEGYSGEVLKSFELMKPFNDYLSVAVS